MGLQFKSLLQTTNACYLDEHVSCVTSTDTKNTRLNAILVPHFRILLPYFRLLLSHFDTLMPIFFSLILLCL